MRHLLISKDKPTIQNTLKIEFICSGWNVHTCGSITDSTNLVEMIPFTAIICGENFPDGSGNTFYKYLRGQSDARRTIPFIFYTGYPWVLTFPQGYRDPHLLGVQATKGNPEADFPALRQALQRLGAT